jgi:hypothetical protein
VAANDVTNNVATPAPGSRAILVVRRGPERALRVALEPGAALVVGRTERAGLVLARDPQLSGAHFRLEWDGHHGTLVDLESAGGTSVDGQRVDGPTPVPHGSWILAGESMFSFYREAATPPRPRAEDGASGGTGSVDPRAKERALLELRPRLGHLYAVLDGARDDRVTELLCEAVDPSRSLYEGARGEALAEVAPYLVELRADSGLLERLVQEGWGKGWGVFLDSRLRFELMRRHLRRFLTVEDETTGELLYFRYYDPRVLRDFLPIGTPLQLSLLLDELDVVLYEGEDGELVRFEPPEPPSAGGDIVS